MDIVRFLKEYEFLIMIALAIVTIALAIVSIMVAWWLSSRKPDKPESEKIGHKLKIKILQLGKKILHILGRRQTRAELLDLSQSINSSLAAIRDILRLHSQSLIDLKKGINEPMTKEGLEDYYLRTHALEKMIDEAIRKWSSIEGRCWEGMYKKDGKIKKRI